MDFTKFSQKIATELEAQFTEYDANHSIFVVPLPDERFQTVVARIMDHPKFNKKVAKIASKICVVTEQEVDYQQILTACNEFVHTRFVIEDDVLKAEASFFYENISETIIKEMIMEVAQTADEWEFKVTGQDIF